MKESLTGPMKDYIEAARKEFEHDDNNELDPGQRVSLADDGAWVEVWHWIPKDYMEEVKNESGSVIAGVVPPSR